MLMNGQKVNHLVINGETFDKSFDGGIKVKAIRDATVGEIDELGRIINPASAPGGFWYVPRGTIMPVIARYKNAVCMVGGYRNYSGWISMDDIEFIDDDKTGGVNKPSYLLFIYCMEEVAPSC